MAKLEEIYTTTSVEKAGNPDPETVDLVPKIRMTFFTELGPVDSSSKFLYPVYKEFDEKFTGIMDSMTTVRTSALSITDNVGSFTSALDSATSQLGQYKTMISDYEQ